MLPPIPGHHQPHAPPPTPPTSSDDGDVYELENFDGPDRVIPPRPHIPPPSTGPVVPIENMPWYWGNISRWLCVCGLCVVHVFVEEREVDWERGRGGERKEIEWITKHKERTDLRSSYIFIFVFLTYIGRRLPVNLWILQMEHSSSVTHPVPLESTQSPSEVAARTNWSVSSTRMENLGFQSQRASIPFQNWWIFTLKLSWPSTTPDWTSPSQTLSPDLV